MRLPPDPMIIQRIDRSDLTDDQLYDFEEAMALFYCRTFHNCRGRVPLTPHRVKAIV